MFFFQVANTTTKIQANLIYSLFNELSSICAPSFDLQLGEIEQTAWAYPRIKWTHWKNWTRERRIMEQFSAIRLVGALYTGIYRSISKECAWGLDQFRTLEERWKRGKCSFFLRLVNKLLVLLKPLSITLCSPRGIPLKPISPDNSINNATGILYVKFVPELRKKSSG